VFTVRCEWDFCVFLRLNLKLKSLNVSVKVRCYNIKKLRIDHT
jgi:hypothetical protein